MKLAYSLIPIYLLLLFKVGWGEACYNTEIEFPKGFANDGSGDEILISSLATDGTDYIWSGG
jgi:hypothetical protein